MSRGLGRIQRACLDVFRRNPGKVLDSITIAGCVVRRNEITNSEHVSVRRALNKLAAAGLVVNMGRKYSDGCRRWALPDAAQGTPARDAVTIRLQNKGRGTIRDTELRQRLLGVLTGRWQSLTMLSCRVPLAPENKQRAKNAGLGENYLIRERLRGMEKSGLVESRKAPSGQREYRLTTKGRQAQKKGR